MGIYCAHFNFSKKGAKKNHLMYIREQDFVWCTYTGDTFLGF